MGFSAMLADEYMLIVPFAYHLQSGLTNHVISAQQKALFAMRNPMKTVYILTFLFLVASQSCFAQTRHFGNYFNKWRYWGPMFTLKADSTFDYIIRTNAGTVTTTKQGDYGTIMTTTDSYIFSDSSFGTYKIIKDTVFFSYATKEIAGDFNGHNIRPTKLYWKGKSLYYIHPQTGAVLRQKEYYMTWSK